MKKKKQQNKSLACKPHSYVSKTSQGMTYESKAIASSELAKTRDKLA